MAWQYQAIKYDYRATLTGTGDRSLSQLDLDLTIEAQSCGREFLSYPKLKYK